MKNEHFNYKKSQDKNNNREPFGDSRLSPEFIRIKAEFKARISLSLPARCCHVLPLTETLKFRFTIP